MKSHILYVMVRKEGNEKFISRDLLVATFYHSDIKKLADMGHKFINDDKQGNWLDFLTVDDFYFEYEETEI